MEKNGDAYNKENEGEAMQIEIAATKEQRGENKRNTDFIQTIRIFRMKKDDLKALYILEFLKFVGCIVCDRIVKMEEDTIIDDWYAEWEDYEEVDPYDEYDKYDVDIILNIEQNTIEKSRYSELNEVVQEGMRQVRRVEFLSISDACLSEEITSTGQNSVLLYQVIRTIWGEKKETPEVLKVLAQKYKGSGLFWYLYVKANFKYIQENFPSKNNASEARTKAYKAILKSYTICYNELVSNELYTRTFVPYYQYAVILLKHKLNGMKQMVGKQAVFHTEGMLEQVEQLAQKRQDFIRLAYLAGNICIKNPRYLGIVPKYLQVAIDLMEGKYGRIRSLDFLYYQLGRYYEKSMGDIPAAENYYKKANSINPAYYRALYKMVCRVDRENQAELAASYAVPLLQILVNGYELNELMPKQQIYAFKSMCLYGKILFDMEKYDVAEKYFRRALEISEAQSHFYDFFPGDREVFLTVQKQGMPSEQVEIELNRCQSIYRH